LVEEREKGRYQTAPPYAQAEKKNRGRRFAVADSKAHDGGSTHLGGLSRLQGSGLAQHMV